MYSGTADGVTVTYDAHEVLQAVLLKAVLPDEMLVRAVAKAYHEVCHIHISKEHALGAIAVFKQEEIPDCVLLRYVGLI